MPFILALMAQTSYRWRGLKCSGCGHEFKNGESVYSHVQYLKVTGHLCQKCYDAKFLDL
jgi:hypothetical protein